jgi:hypothetical protein
VLHHLFISLDLFVCDDVLFGAEDRGEFGDKHCPQLFGEFLITRKQRVGVCGWQSSEHAKKTDPDLPHNAQVQYVLAFFLLLLPCYC